MFNLSIETENAAFEESPAAEIARILRDVAARLDRYGLPDAEGRPVNDANGNRVGRYTYAAPSVAGGEGILCIVDSSRGIYGPQYFATHYGRDWGLSKYDRRVLESGPDHPEYWETWESVLDSATMTDSAGNEWRLYADSDIYATCDSLISDSEYLQFFGESRE